MISKFAFARTKPPFRPFGHWRAPLHTSSRLYGRKVSQQHISRFLLSTDEGLHLEELDELLAKPTWSVESLLPPKTPSKDASKISPEQLHHLLRLSALPLPATQEEEEKMLDTLSAQLHFVGQMQQVDTTDVAPLQAIRDETVTAEREQSVTLETLKEALAQEKVVGKHHKRIQRNPEPVDAKEVEDWDVLGSAGRKVGRYFVVESERPQE